MNMQIPDWVFTKVETNETTRGYVGKRVTVWTAEHTHMGFRCEVRRDGWQSADTNPHSTFDYGVDVELWKQILHCHKGTYFRRAVRGGYT